MKDENPTDNLDNLSLKCECKHSETSPPNVETFPLVIAITSTLQTPALIYHLGIL